MDYSDFFGRKADVVARDLLGRMLIRKTETDVIGGQIVETGAYEGDNGSDSRSGMKYAPGELFLMPYRGAYLLNIATEREGIASCVEIRGLRFHGRKINGSGLIRATLNIPKELDGQMLGKEIKIKGESVKRSLTERTEGNTPNSTGYFYLSEN